MMRKTVSNIILIVMIFAAVDCFGWGAGHRDNAELVIKYLPEKIATFLTADQKQLIVKKWCKYPDGHKPDPKIMTMLGKQCTDEMEKQRIVRYQLHSSKGKVFSFIQLVNAFRNKNSQRVAFWSAVLMHTIADESAFNHGPLIHYMTYARYKHVKYASAGILDLSIVRREPELMKMIINNLKNYEVAKIPGSPQQILKEIMLSGIKQNSVMTSREARLAAAVNLTVSPKAKRNALKAMAEVAAFQVETTVNIIYTAWRLAQADERPELNSQLFKDFKKAKRKLLVQRPLTQDSIYSGLLNNSAKEQNVGIVFEGSRRLNAGLLGFSSKFISSCIGRILSNEQINIMPVKCLTLMSKPLPEPKLMPILIICTGNRYLSASYRKNIKNYSDRGGKLLWIGGNDFKVLGKLSQALVKEKDEILPVSKRYGVRNADTVKKTKVIFKNQFATALNRKEFIFRANPNTPAGWHKPWCPYSIKTNPKNIVPLCELQVGKNKFCVAAILKDENGKAKAIWLPEYLVAPFLLSNDDHMPDWSKPVLDSVGAKLMLASIKILKDNKKILP